MKNKLLIQSVAGPLLDDESVYIALGLQEVLVIVSFVEDVGNARLAQICAQFESMPHVRK